MFATDSLKTMGFAASAGLLLLASCRSSSTDHASALYDRYRPRPTALDQPAPKYSARDAIEVQYAVARSLEEEKNWRGAERAYLRILEQNPSHADSVHRLAILYDRQSRFKESEKYFRKALKLRPGAPNLFCDIGYSYYRQRRWADAEMMLKQAIAINKTHARAHNHLGLLYAQLDRPKDSLTEFKLAGCNQAQAHMNVALVLSLNDRLKEAQQQYQIALNADPASNEIRSRLQKIESVIAKTTPQPEPPKDSVHVARHEANRKAATRQAAAQRPAATQPPKPFPASPAPVRQTRPSTQPTIAAPQQRPSTVPGSPTAETDWRRLPPLQIKRDRQPVAPLTPEQPANIVIMPRRTSGERVSHPPQTGQERTDE